MKRRPQTFEFGICFVLALAGSTLGSTTILAQDTEPFTISYEQVLEDSDGLDLPYIWSFRDSGFVEQDGSPRHIDARLPWESSDANDFSGDGLFELTVNVDSSLIGTPIGVEIKHFGISQLYVDGVLVRTFGEEGEDTSIEPALLDNIGLITFHDSTHHVVGLLYSNPDYKELHSVQYNAGFELTFGDVNKLIEARQKTVRLATFVQSGMTALFTMFGLLHIFMYIFYPRRRENLLFALVAFTIALVLFNNFHEAYFYNNADQLIAIRRMWAPLSLSVVFSFLVFLYLAFQTPIPKYFYFLLGIGVIIAIWGWYNPRLGWQDPAGGRTYAYAFALVVQAVILVNAFRGIVQRRVGSIFIGAGVVAMVSAFTYPILVVLGFMQAFDDLLVFSNFVILGLFLAISFYLSRRFAQTSISLENKLVEVTELSEQRLNDERKIREQEIERNLLEAGYEQKLRELEEARQLQLSMLPTVLPKHRTFELATYMQTATEVGGDYYDFHLAADGTLTIAVGDATGHGMKAGMMVTATKSLFNSMSQNKSLLEVFDRTTRALKLMNLRQIYMALTLSRLKAGAMTIATAGMPPTLIYRAGEDKVEVIKLKGMPLGSFVEYPYEKREVDLAAGDTVLFMSDGLPELFNENGDMFGYDRVVTEFQGIAGLPSDEIIDRLVSICREWSGSRAQDDDITFVVLKLPPSANEVDDANLKLEVGE